MSRRTKSVRRNLIPDSKYDSTEVTKFINNLMVDGKKSLAEKIFYGSLDICEEKSSQPGLNILEKFKDEIKQWIPINCPYSLCNQYVPGVGIVATYE